MSSPFGSTTRTRLMIALSLLDSSYPRELSRLLDTAVNNVQAGLRSLERDGLVVARTMGRTRVFQINPRYFAAGALRAFVHRLAEADPALAARAAGARRRPRRTAKPL